MTHVKKEARCQRPAPFFITPLSDEPDMPAFELSDVGVAGYALVAALTNYGRDAYDSALPKAKRDAAYRQYERIYSALTAAIPGPGVWDSAVSKEEAFSILQNEMSLPFGVLQNDVDVRHTGCAIFGTWRKCGSFAFPNYPVHIIHLHLRWYDFSMNSRKRNFCELPSSHQQN